MKGNPDDRCVLLGQYIADSGDTVRGAAKKFCISKSTVHKDVTQRLKRVNKPLYKHVCEILEVNKAQRHIRGGEATRRKYRQQ